MSKRKLGQQSELKTKKSKLPGFTPRTSKLSGKTVAGESLFVTMSLPFDSKSAPKEEAAMIEHAMRFDEDMLVEALEMSVLLAPLMLYRFEYTVIHLVDVGGYWHMNLFDLKDPREASGFHAYLVSYLEEWRKTNDAENDVLISATEDTLTIGETTLVYSTEKSASYDEDEEAYDYHMLYDKVY